MVLLLLYGFIYIAVKLDYLYIVIPTSLVAHYRRVEWCCRYAARLRRKKPLPSGTMESSIILQHKREREREKERDVEKVSLDWCFMQHDSALPKRPILHAAYSSREDISRVRPCSRLVCNVHDSSTEWQRLRCKVSF